MYKATLILLVSSMLLAAPVAAVQRVVGANAPDGGALLVKRFSVTSGTSISGAEFMTNDLETVFPKVLLLAGPLTRLATMEILAQALDVPSDGNHRIFVGLGPVTISEDRDIYLAVALPPSDGVVSKGRGAGVVSVQLEAPQNSYFISERDLTDRFGPMDVEYIMELVASGPATKTQSPGAGDGRSSESITTMIWTGSGSGVVLDFNLPRPASVRLSIHDVRGRLVSRLADETLPAGLHRRVLDGADGRGRGAPSGVYIARLLTDHGTITRKVVLTVSVR